MRKQSVGFICGIFHPKLAKATEKKNWYFREDELEDVFREFLHKPVLFEHEGQPIGRVEEIKIANIGEELMCYIDVYPEGKFIMDRLEKGEVLGLSVGYESDEFKGRRVGKFEGQEISITTSPAYETTWIVANYSNNEFRISKTGIDTLTQNSKKKSGKSQIKMSEFKAGKDILEANSSEKNTVQLDVEELRTNYEKAVKENALYKSGYVNLFNTTVRPEFEATVGDIEESLKLGLITEDTSNSMKEYLRAPGNSPFDGMITEKLTRVRATANMMGTIKRLNSQLLAEKSQVEKLTKAVDEQAKRPRITEEIAGAQIDKKVEEMAKRGAEELSALDGFLLAKTNKAETLNHVAPVSKADINGSLDYELRRYGLI